MPEILKALLDQATAQQDYAWFCVLLAWVILSALLYLSRPVLREHRAVFWWLVLTLAGGFALAGAELVMHAWPPRPFQAERVGWDRWLSAALLVQGLAVLPLLARPSFWRRVTLMILVGVLIGAWWLRRTAPVPANGGLALAALGLGVAALLVLRPTLASPFKPRFLLVAPLLSGLATLGSTTGLVSELTTQQRRWTELSLLGLPSAFLQLLLAGTLIAGLSPGRILGRGHQLADSTDARRDVRLMLGIFAAWLVFGFGMSWWTGQAARRTYEENLMGRARAASALVDPAHVLPVVGPGFRLEVAPAMSQDNGRKNPLAKAPYLLGVYKPTADDLARVEAVNPDIQWSHFLTFRDGFVVSCVFSSKLRLVRDSVALHRRITAEDESNWGARRVFFQGPVIGSWGEKVRALAPIVHPQAGMLGWVALDFGASDWTAAQALARLQTFALIGVGALVLVLVLVQRLRAHEHALTLQQAAVAQAADRAKTAFLAKVSHELRTPVQSILGYSELFSHLPLEDKPTRWLGAIRSQGQLLIRLVNDLLDLSAIQSGAFKLVPRPVNLSLLVRSCVDSLQPRAAGRNLALHCETDPAVPPWLELDPERVRQVLFNLLGNALKFTDEGEIRVGLRYLGATGPAARVALTVQDTGPGISPEQQASLFRPFSRLREHADREGTGLGLALTAALCQSMHGEVRIVSDGIHGSEFIAEFQFPLSSAPVPATPGKPAPASLANLRVLIADDNALVCELYLSGLTAAGAWCETASDGLEAVERCANEPFDVVVLDVSMPWLDGMESARRIRAHGRAGLRIVGVSAHAGTAERELGLAAGMDVFLVKPVALADLLAAVAGASRADPAPDNAAILALLRRLREQFAGEAPRLLGELGAACEAGDRRWLRTRAHHLKNSADVAGYPEISLLCSQIESLISGQETAGQGQVLSRLVSEIRDAWRRVKPDSAPPLPGTPGEKQP